MSTPDTGPGFWNCYTPPSDGYSYLMLITRGPLGPYANTTEDCGTELQEALVPGTTYSYRIDLALSDSWGHDTWDGWVSYANAVRLRFWCASGNCGRVELLWETPAITHTDWVRYELDLQPTVAACDHLILEAWYESFPEYFGNVLVDNFRPATSASLPNIITPNSDGSNDALVIDRWRAPSVQVFNRWGHMVYENPAYSNDWTAKGLPDGVYYYVVDSRSGIIQTSTLQILR